MKFFSNLVLPLVIAAITTYGLFKKVDIFDVFLDGAKTGLKSAVKILPALVGLITAVGMFKASGGLDMLTFFLRPVAGFLGLPSEVLPLAVVRPLSGSGALAVFQDVLTQHGPDSYIGKVASVMQGSTETTFYTIALYYGAAGTKKTRHSLPSALTGDLTGFIVSAIAVRLFLM